MIRCKDFQYAFDHSMCSKCKAICCKGEGYVFLDDSDINNIADFLNMDKDAFLKLYTKKAFYNKKISLISLKIAKELKCVFLNDKDMCEIYRVRPKQCRRFPFWKNLKDKNKTYLAKLCPGIIILPDK